MTTMIKLAAADAAARQIPEAEAAAAINAKRAKAGWLGAASGSVRRTPEGRGWYQDFAKGAIYYAGLAGAYTNSVGAFEVHGAILAKWRKLGASASFLGFPVIDEGSTPDGVGRYSRFENGSIYWTQKTGAFEVHGMIKQKWSQLGFERSILGYPVSDELVTDDGRGRYSNFQGGSIYWSPETGAFEVHGLIRSKWKSLGADESFLGYPVSDERTGADGTSRYSDFQRGQIAWSPTHGAAVSATTFVAAAPGQPKPQGLNSQGLPEVRRRVVCNAHLYLTDDEWLGSDEHSDADKSAEVVLTNGSPQEVIRVSDGAGGELRVELTLNAQVREAGDVRMVGMALLYEGTSEQDSDLDGDEPISFLVPRDGFVSKEYTVSNENEGGDTGVITLTVSNFAV